MSSTIVGTPSRKRSGNRPLSSYCGERESQDRWRDRPSDYEPEERPNTRERQYALCVYAWRPTLSTTDRSQSGRSNQSRKPSCSSFSLSRADQSQSGRSSRSRKPSSFPSASPQQVVLGWVNPINLEVHSASPLASPQQIVLGGVDPVNLVDHHLSPLASPEQIVVSRVNPINLKVHSASPFTGLWSFG